MNTKQLLIKKYFMFLIVSLMSIIFIGCSDEQTDTNSPTQWGGDGTAKYYDYYEIANNTIVHTSINDDPYNYSMLINGYLNSDTNYITMNNQFIDDYNLTNIALDKNETFNAWKTSYFNTFTNKSMTTTHKEYFGLYELSTNYCVINSDVENCKTYIYIRK